MRDNTISVYVCKFNWKKLWTWRKNSINFECLKHWNIKCKTSHKRNNFYFIPCSCLTPRHRAVVVDQPPLAYVLYIYVIALRWVLFVDTYVPSISLVHWSTLTQETNSGIVCWCHWELYYCYCNYTYSYISTIPTPLHFIRGNSAYQRSYKITMQCNQHQRSSNARVHVQLQTTTIK
jgi:hypothetical protein